MAGRLFYDLTHSNIRWGRLAALFAPGYGKCESCHTPWKFVQSHSVLDTPWSGHFYVCERCWKESDPTGEKTRAQEKREREICDNPERWSNYPNYRLDSVHPPVLVEDPDHVFERACQTPKGGRFV